MNKRRLAIIIVHYKTPAMLRDCLASLLPQINPITDQILIVDNASTPPYKADGLQSVGPAAPITLIESPTNLGFAGANNLAFRQIFNTGSADYFLLLNPDTLLRPNALATLFDFLETHLNAAVVGPRLEYPDATPQQSAFGPITPISELVRGASIGPITRLFKKHQVAGPVRNQPHQTHWLAGACILMRASLLQHVGLLDDRFFMYFEEVDFFRRVSRVARASRSCTIPPIPLEIWYQPAAHVVHLVGQSSGILRSPEKGVRDLLLPRKRLPAYWFDSRHRYFRKHFGYLGLLAADLLWLLGHSLNLTRKLVTGTSHAHLAPSETTDLLRHSTRHLLHPRPLA